MSSWAEQDPILIRLWRRGDSVDFILAEITRIGPPRKKADIYPRLGELRKRGEALPKRPPGKRPEMKREPVFEGTFTRVDDEGRTVTVCPPRWCAGARRSMWER